VQRGGEVNLTHGGTGVIEDADLLSRWRAARLAAVAEDMARLGHDLRGILSPALLSAERLLTSTDPSARRSAEVMLRAVDRAAAAVSEAVGSINRSVGIQRTPVVLRDALSEALPGRPLENRIAPDITVTVQADHLAQLLRSVLAGAAGRIVASAALEPRSLVLTLRLSPPAPPANETEAAVTALLARAMGGSVARSADGAQETITLTVRRY
jgi:hypothetical protein